MNAVQSVDYWDRDPEHLMNRCSGINKKTKHRCATAIAQSSQLKPHAKYLPTCASHRKQQTHAGWCQARRPDGNSCGRLFRWTPPYLQLCADHCKQVNADAPCYFLKLPTEMRQEIFKYLLPSRAIDSVIFYRLTGPYHGIAPGVLESRSALRAVFQTPLSRLYLGFNREVYGEIRDLFYSTMTFTIDVSRDGVMLCGHRILEPKRPDGQSYYVGNQKENDEFIRNFAWAAVKNYTVNIAVEWRASTQVSRNSTHGDWDEEVELYDIRDFVSVVVSGVLAKSTILCRLQVCLNFTKISWAEEHLVSSVNILVGPFERLRCVRQPRLVGVFASRQVCNPRHQSQTDNNIACFTQESRPMFGPGNATFDALATKWEHCIASQGSTRILPRPPITSMFTEFRNFHNKLSEILCDLHQRGRSDLLHRARVAREQEDVAAFRALRTELMQYWFRYLERQEAFRIGVNVSLSQMLDADTYGQNDGEAPSVDARRKLQSLMKLGK